MTDQWNNGPGIQDPPASSTAGSRNERWIRRPRRSTGDRKIAGVAGGLGRAFGIDPVLIRVAFVVLTVFGGFGGLLYVLGWLLLAADGDEVSAAEALLGRGTSSVPPALAVGLGVVAVISAFSMFSWGLPFLPLAIGGVIVLAIMRRRGRHGQRWSSHGQHWSRGPWSPGERRGPGGYHGDWMERTDEQVRAWSEKVEDWTAGARRAEARSGRGAWGGCGSPGRWGGPGCWGGSSSRSPANSPFEQPAFWDQPPTSSRADGSSGRTPGSSGSASGVNMTKSAHPADPSTSHDSPMEVGFDDTGFAAPRTTPPAWDPLGVAPFAWDLPEPTPLPQPSATMSRRGAVLGRVGLGATLLVGGLTAAGVIAGWWALSWAQVSGIALGVLALGLLFSALRGRGYSLIGPGVFLSLVTLALAVTGVSGTSGYGQVDYQPAAYSELQESYSFNAGDLTLDLTAITIPDAGRTISVDLKAGHAHVVVPPGMDVVANCEVGLGQTDCLGNSTDGVKQQSHGNQPGAKGSGTLTLNVKVNAGFAEVSTDE